MAIIEDMIWTVKPIPTKDPITIITVDIATIIGAIINGKFLKKYQRRKKIAKPASGAATPI